MAGTVRASSFNVPNPNSSGATVNLNWHDDVARIRYGGSGTGSQNGLAIQGQNDSTKLRLLDDGSLGLATSEPQARLHVRTKNLSIETSALENDDIIVEGQDAVLGLYSEPQGTWASAIAFKEISGGLLVDAWGIARQTSPHGSDLYFTYGASENYASNPATMVLTATGSVGIGTSSPADKLDVLGDGHFSGSLSIDGMGRFENDVEVASTSSSQRSLIESHAFRLYNSAGIRVFNMYSNANGGGSEAFWANGAGTDTIEVDPDESDAGVIRLSNAAGTATVVLDASDANGNGRISTDVLQINGADLSEQFDIGGSDAIEPGMVVSIDPANPGKLTIATEAYDSKVAGIVSGAGNIRTGVVMGQEGTIAHGQYAVALTGRVWCHVDAGFGAVTPGDQLTTSTTPGYAMKASDHDRARGAVLGKAMTALESGTGLVLVLVQPN
ncbi:MAG TPA: hypothetical protein P5572_14985 [Phycisphaerae bacterium]|nr:hypothetical protein [Phycisphaerae bacterium]